ncbi:MAG TPA: four helix bundle protein [Dehalococcoidia bacterium]|nr:four helix bundle protein [Dehalococcoidia bacterium]
MKAGEAQPVRSSIRSHRDLIVWQKAMDLADAVYDLADHLPQRENYGLWTQITRAVVSVPANIAEGHARSTRKDFANFLAMARGSLMEVDTLLGVAVRRRYVTESDAEKVIRRIEEISKMLTSLRGKLAPRRGAS